MKLTLPKTTVEASHEFVDQSFAIGDLAVIMEILRGKMYSNPIRTICQEIGSNARDAHRELGKRDVPIHIKLPSKLVPTFEVRDFGPGITPDRMANIFLKYGCSTKRDDNTQTGGFGLGAKSPFAYSDTFGIESVTPEKHFQDKENVMVKRTYVAFIDPTRIGKLSLLSAEVTDEQQGTKIIVTCKPGDEDKFKEHVLAICQYWPKAGDPLPTVTGHGDFKWAEKEKPMFEGIALDHGTGTAWELDIPKNHYHRVGKVTAVVDGIPFPVNESDIGNMSDDLRRLFSKNLTMYFNVGDLSLTANREELDYQTPTINKVKQVMSVIRKSLAKIFEAKLKDCKNFWEASVLWRQVKFEFSGLIDAVQWNGLKVAGEAGYLPDMVGSCRRYKKDSMGKITSYRNNSFQYDDDVVVAIDDTDAVTPSRGRIDAMTRKYPNKGVMVFKFLGEPTFAPDHDDKAYRDQRTKEYKEKKKDWEDEHHPELWDAIKLSTVEPIKYSNYVQPTSADGTPVKRKPLLKVREYHQTSSVDYSRIWRESEDNSVTVEEGSGLYVVLKDKTAYLDDECSKSIQGDLVGKLAEYLGDDTKVYGIQARYVHRKGDGWKPLNEAALSKFRAQLAKATIVSDGELEHRIERVVDSTVVGVIKDSKNADLCEWIKESKEYDANRNATSELTAIALILGVQKELGRHGSMGLKGLRDKVLAKFPLLPYISTMHQVAYSNSHAHKAEWKQGLQDYVK